MAERTISPRRAALDAKTAQIADEAQLALAMSQSLAEVEPEPEPEADVYQQYSEFHFSPARNSH
jgi:hypothetical protein